MDPSKDREELPEKTDPQVDAPAEPPVRPDPDKITVDTDEEVEIPGQPQQQTADRQSRRQERRALKDELKSRNEAYAKLEREVAELRGALQSRPAVQYVPQPARAAAPADPTETEISSIEEQQNALNLAIANPKLEESRVQKLTEAWNRLERQKQELVTKRVLERQGALNQPSFDPFEMQVAMLQAQFPEIYTNPIAMKQADLEYARMVAAGKPATFATAVEAAQRVRGQGNNRRPEPSEADKSRYVSVPSRAGGSGGRNEFTPSKQQLINARAMYAHLDIPDEDKVKLWHRNVGVRSGLVKNGA